MKPTQPSSSLGHCGLSGNRISKILGAGFFLVIAALVAVAQSTNDSSSDNSSTTDFSSFQLIVDRNIFNPDRYPRMARYRREPQGVPTFSLAGTMSYRKGMFAFFNGTSDDYRKALQQGGTIAGYTVAKITFDGVQLQAAGKTIDMKVGAAMRQNGSEWELSAPGEWGSISSTETESGSENNSESPAASPAPPAPTGAGSDILKRLMEQRQQELK